MRKLFFVSMFFFLNTVYSQTAKDTLIRKSVYSLQRKLNFTNDQADKIYSVFKKQHDAVSVISADDLVKRKLMIKESNRIFRKELKDILTREQWKQYEEAEMKENEKLLKRMQARKAKYTLVE